jgi:glycosyltransferase involved in cell wall biosynthesis
VVGIPSKTADSVVFKYSKKVHYMKSGLNTSVFIPKPNRYNPVDDEPTPPPIPIPSSLKPHLGSPTTSTPISHPESLNLARKLTSTISDGTIDAPVLLYVGRLAVEKNIEFLIKSLAHPALSQASLVIVGDGPLRPSLESLAASVVGKHSVYSHSSNSSSSSSHSSSSSSKTPTSSTFEMPLGADARINGSRYRVLFMGMVINEVVCARYYASANVFVSASASETFGFTVAEAMGAGTPAVVVRSGAFATVYKVIDGWMYEEGNVDDYVGRIVRVLLDGEVAVSRVGRRITVGSFGVGLAVRDLLKIYEWCVDGGSMKEAVAAKIEIVEGGVVPSSKPKLV